MVYNISPEAQAYIIFKDKDGQTYAAKCFNPIITQNYRDCVWLSGMPMQGDVSTKIEAEIGYVKLIENLLPFEVTEEEVLKVLSEE